MQEAGNAIHMLYAIVSYTHTVSMEDYKKMQVDGTAKAIVIGCSENNKYAGRSETEIAYSFCKLYPNIFNKR